jgi:2-polyprenyl-3-methyl-5-hydroxy-6-metoxy-1,4-benzoquinol methylase
MMSLPNAPQKRTIEEIYDFGQHSRDRWVYAKSRTVPQGAKVLDVGAGTCPYRKFFSHCDYKTQDFKKYEGPKLWGAKDYGQIDFESDIIDIPVDDNSYDVILCTEVLEHVPEPVPALKELARIINP